ncbi:hypothetical protein BJ980_002007 [Nocardioides daedukensis]|uniref:Uncharacterized protein n=1 Tax=Nocardioides daedukensis TaxID=634462 RepID=A0A7Y9UTT1_9ACTN|nr:hypothetical protein [Nocardioides daedukensis]NYG59084.1 hypothetical protein [Nocardioides daedukensis]
MSQSPTPGGRFGTRLTEDRIGRVGVGFDVRTQGVERSGLP